jgi:hypothetical protein
LKRPFMCAAVSSTAVMVVLLGALFVAFAQPLGDVALAAGTAPTASAAGALTFTADTVVIPAAVVRSQLIGIAPGGVFKFKHASGPLGQLKPGKVMLLQGSAAGIVTAVQTKSGQLIVTTRDATLGQVVESGTIPIDVAPDFSKAFTAPINFPDDGVSTARATAPVFSVPGAPYVPAARPADAGSLAIQGGSGPWGYSISGSVKGPHQLDLSGTICLGYKGADDCGNGPSRAVAVAIGFTGTLDLDKLSGDVQVAHGTVEKLAAAFSGVKAQFKTNYTFSRGDSAVQAKFPPIHVPIGWDIPIPNPYLPLFVRVQFGALLQVVSRPAKNTVSHGAMTGQIEGTAAASDSGGKTGPAPAGADEASGEVDPGNQGLGISLAPLGIDVTVQEKAGLALGVSVANLMAFTDFTATIGQEQSSAIAGGFCSSYIGVLDWGVGLGAELGGGVLGAQLQKRWSVLTRTYHHTEPGCKPIS